MGSLEASPLFDWLWSSSNLGKHKFFFWLLLRDQLNTRNILRRKNRDLDDYNCVLCNSGCEETLLRLFLSCPFSQDCWNTLHIHWNLNLDPLDMVIEARTTFGHCIFREIMITACWIIWKLEMTSFLTMEFVTSRFERGISRRSLVWCVPMPSRLQKDLYLFGETITPNVSFFFSFLGLAAL